MQDIQKLTGVNHHTLNMVHSLVFDELMTAILKILGKLDLTSYSAEQDEDVCGVHFVYINSCLYVQSVLTFHHLLYPVPSPFVVVCLLQIYLYVCIRICRNMLLIWFPR